ncbi:MAG: HlyD family efflux transporter periplasmic adaptor subunit [Phycisphaerae bacterium]|nr:HlyD family efflux transporter periplasmic adaptor subunit [Phycisphaerae bacterium]
MQKYWKTTIVATIVLTLIGSMIAKKVIQKATKKDDATAVRIEEVKLGDLTEYITAPGAIEPKTKVNISAKVSARIIELPYEEGSIVTAGNPNANPPVPPSVLIRLDSKDLESRLRSTQARYKAQQASIEVSKTQIAAQKAQLEGTRATLAQAQRDFERQKQLLATKDISQSVFDLAQQKLEEFTAQVSSSEQNIIALEKGLVVAEHNLESTAAEIEEAQEAVGYTTITSPLDGTITRTNAKVGEVVMTGTMNNPGTIIMVVADLSKMLLVAQIDESDIGKVRLGQEAEIRVKAFWDEKFKGVVEKIALTNDSAVTGAKYYRTEILMQGDVKKLYSGLTADVDIFTDKHTNIIKVPSQAVLGRKVDDLPLNIRENNPNVDANKNDAMVVYRIIDGKTVVTPVTIGPGDMTHIIIKSGLTEGDKIVIGPYKILETLKHDQKVRDEREVEKEKKEKEKKDKAKSAESAKPSKVETHS